MYVLLLSFLIRSSLLSTFWTIAYLFLVEMTPVNSSLYTPESTSLKSDSPVTRVILLRVSQTPYRVSGLTDSLWTSYH